MFFFFLVAGLLSTTLHRLVRHPLTLFRCSYNALVVWWEASVLHISPPVRSTSDISSGGFGLYEVSRVLSCKRRWPIAFVISVVRVYPLRTRTGRFLLEPLPFTMVTVLSRPTGLLNGLIWALSGSWGCGHEASQTASLFPGGSVAQKFRSSYFGFHFVRVCFWNPFGFGVLNSFWVGSLVVLEQLSLGCVLDSARKGEGFGIMACSGWVVVVILLFVVCDGDMKLIDSVLADNFTFLWLIGFIIVE